MADILRHKGLGSLRHVLFSIQGKVDPAADLMLFHNAATYLLIDERKPGPRPPRRFHRIFFGRVLSVKPSICYHGSLKQDRKKRKKEETSRTHANEQAN